MLRSLIVLGSLFPSLFPSHQSDARKEEELQRAEKNLAETSQQRNEARDSLDRVYVALETFHQTMSADEGSEAASELLRAFQESRTEWFAGPSEGIDAVSAKSQTQSFFRKSIAAKLTSGAKIPAPLIDPLASKFAAAAVAETALASADFSETAKSVLAYYLDPKIAFDQNWIRLLQRELPFVRQYEKSQNDYAEALERIERLRRPDRFHPAYRKIPEGMTLVLGGSFSLGENTGWDLDSSRTQKKHTANLKPFFIDRYEVSNRQYRAFLENLSAEDLAERIPSTWTKTSEGGFLAPEGKDEHPVAGISWEDAAAYAAWLGKRLPTEDEWEAAARGPKSQIYPWGDSFEAWRPNHNGVGPKDTAPVGSFLGDRSFYGCFDMAGNVGEWTATSPDGKTYSKLKTNANMVLRGGSFRKGAASASAIYRWAYPGLTTREADLGFRCVQDIPR